MTHYETRTTVVLCDFCGKKWEQGQLPNGKRPVTRRYCGISATMKMDLDFCCKAHRAEFEAANPQASQC